MLASQEKYANYALVKEMLETAEVVRKLDTKAIIDCGAQVKAQKILLTGEGSSRIFPAKKTIYDSYRNGYSQMIYTEGATQALEYKLDDSMVFVASNSGKTKEGVRLIRHCKSQGHSNLFGVVANAGTPILEESDGSYQLICGKEDAVAATKSVVEQALFYDILLRSLNGREMPDLNKLGDLIEETLQAEVPEEVMTPLVKAPILYWAGRNTGAAEELRLKTNEITRKNSDFLEGTYAAHGIEEVMDANESIIVINPFSSEEEKFQEVLIQGVGLKIVAISSQQSSFPTFTIPSYGDFSEYLELVAGWSLLVEIGIANKIDLDKPVRARKVGNEFIG